MKRLILIGLTLAATFGTAGAKTEVSGELKRNTTWTAKGSPYVVVDDVVIPEGMTLKIEPGVVVKFHDLNDDLIVEGTLVAKGTSSSPIYFTSYKDDSVGGDTDGEAVTPEPDDWGGIVFRKSSSSSVLEHVVVRYGGYYWSNAGDAGIRCVGASPQISECVISHIGGDGIYCESGGCPELVGCRFEGNAKGVNSDVSSHPVVKNCRFEGNDWPIGVYPEYSGVEYVSTDNQISGNTHDGILVYGGEISSEVRWESVGGVPYVVDNDVRIAEGGVLRVGEGVIVKFMDGSDDLIVDGVLIARGSGSSPAYFTSYEDDEVGGDTNADSSATAGGPDQWGGIRFNPTSDDSLCLLEHVVVRYGGYYWSNTGDRNIFLAGASPTFRNCTFGDAGGTSIFIGEGSHPRIVDCVFSNPGDWPIDAPAEGLENVGPNTYTGNGHDGIYISRGEVSSYAEWKETGAPFFLATDLVVDSLATLKVLPGVVVKASGGGTDVVVRGKLVAEGTSSSWIYFTSYQDDEVGGDTNADGSETVGEPDQWGGIRFEGGSQGSMKYVVVRYGGYYWSNAGDAGIRCVGASPQISECVISYIGGDGIYCQSGATPIVRHCWIYDNTGYGLRNVDASVTVDATNNWWGDPSGPYHEDLNPDGKGNPVSDNVAFSPWLRTPPTGPAIDTVPPTITSGPSVPEISDTYAVIRWTTDEVSSSMVQYGTTMAYGLVAVGPEGTEHSVMLEGLAPSTTYHFRVGSRDAGGNVVWSEDFTFTTLAFPRLVGDFDGDGDVDFDDFFLFVAHFGTSSDQPNFDPTFDITDDGKVNFEDFFAFVVHFGQSRQAKVAALRPSLSVEVKEGDLGPVVEVKTREAEGFGLVLRYNPEAYEFLRAEVSSELPILVKDEPGRLAFGCVGDGAKLVFFRKDELGGAMEVSKAVVVDASYGVLDAGVRRSLIVPEFALGKVHPNPFNSSAVVEYVLPKAGQVRLVVYDLLGQEVRVLVDGIQSAGRYRVVWDGRDEFGRAVASGVYLVRMEASPFQKIRKVTLVR